MKIFRKCMAAVLAVSMSFPMVPAAPARASAQDGLLAEYVFADSDVTDKVIEDASGNGNDARLEGKGASISQGMLTLPGGAKDSGAAYVSLPGTLFEGQDTLTITTWLKNGTGSNNYSAMYFGTTSKHIGGGSANYPLNYWILNPKNPDGKFKSVWTDANNEGAPYNTETAVSAADTSSDWGLYTTVITPGAITGYYNGVEVSSSKKTKTTTDFGTGLIAFIGRSAYNDMYYKGGVYGVKVYNRPLSRTEIWDEYYNHIPAELDHDARIDAAISQEKAALLLDEIVTGDLQFPLIGQKGAVITWNSGKKDVISDDGKVTIPTDKEANVAVTATISIGNKSDTKTFQLKVPAVPRKTQFENKVAGLTVGGYFVTQDLELPHTVGEHTAIQWTSSNTDVLAIVEEGGKTLAKVTRPQKGQGDAEVSLEANAVYQDGQEQYSSKKSFRVKVREEDGAYLMAYTNSKEKQSLGSSLHLAYSLDGREYTALNSNTGICFARNEGGTKNVNPNGLESLYIFRKADGTYGLVARNITNQTYIYVYDSTNLVEFNNERKLELGHTVSGGLKVSAECSQGQVFYQIFWESGDKKYKTVTTDFQNIGTVAEAEYQKEEISGECKVPEGANVGNIMSISSDEYQYVTDKLGVVKNTGIQNPEIEAAPGSETDIGSLLPAKVTADYSDGSTAELPVTWDHNEAAAVDLSKVGTYNVTGTIVQTKYPNPFIEQRADPCILLGADGYYYFTASYPVCGDSDKEGYDRIVLRRSETIAGLATAEEISIWDCDWPGSESEYRYVWAPEIRLVNGNYYVFYTSSIEGNVWSIRPHVLKCTDPENIMDPESWQAMGLMQAKAGDSKAFSGFSLDMTVFENQGRWYVIWAQSDGFSSLFLAEIDKNEPWKCISESVKISFPEYSWERQVENVDEGPSVIKNNGKIYVAFSAAGTGPEYCVGLISIDENADMLDKNAWKKQPYPVLTSSDVPGEYGPGHNSFTEDEEGNPIFVYHARGEQCYKNQCQWASSSSLNDPCRDARLKRVHWAADGTPILKMSYEEELAEENKTVTATIKVQIPVSGVTLNKTELSLTVGASETLTATVIPPDAGDKSVQWKTSNPAVAEVTQNGTVTAKSAGSAEITVETANGKTAKCTVTVTTGNNGGGDNGNGNNNGNNNNGNNDNGDNNGGNNNNGNNGNGNTGAQVKVDKVKLNKSKITLGVKETFALKADVTPKKATNGKVTWVSNKPKIVSVNKNTGKITAKKKGKAVITATADGKTAKCTVTVKAAPKKITLNKKSVVLKKKKTFKIRTKLPKNTASYKITYKSNKSSVASVDAKGKITAKKKGQATITVTTFNKKKAKLKVTVK